MVADRHDAGRIDGRPYLTMALIEGRPLDDLIDNDRPLSQNQAAALVRKVAMAVQSAHTKGVIHRALKPANVMVGSFGEVQVMDWGLAKVLTSRERQRPEADPDETTGGTEVRSLRDSDGPLTQAGSVLGTPAFMPPEQAAGAVGKVDARSDVFGLGGVLAVILTGQPPFAGSSAETTRVKAAQGQVEECFARLDEYVDLEVAGADADAAVPGLRAHLAGCPACREEHESLLALVREDRPL